MSIYLYTDRADVPAHTRVIDSSDEHFYGIPDSRVADTILKDIDKAIRIDTNTYSLIDIPELGRINASCLSTGTKVLLNIITHPDVCFNLIECGNNALNKLSLIDEGVVLWETPVIYTDKKDQECDICYCGRRFNSFTSLFKYMDGDDI